MNYVESAIQHVKDMKMIFRELLDDGTSESEFKSCIEDLNKIQTSGSRILIRLIQSHLDSLQDCKHPKSTDESKIKDYQ